MVARIELAISITVAGSAAPPAPVTGHRGWTVISHLLGSGSKPSGPSSGHVGVIGKYGILSACATELEVGEHRVRLLRAHHGDRHDRHAGAHRNLHEAATPERRSR